MYRSLLLLALSQFIQISAFAAESIFLDCQIPEDTGSYTGSSGKQVTVNSPGINLAITLNEAESKASQVFKSSDDNYSFTADAQFTPTEILYETKRKKSFVRIDRFSIDRTTLVVKFSVEYPSMGTTQAREGNCKIVPRPQTKI